jgi:hypothetical protein
MLTSPEIQRLELFDIELRRNPGISPRPDSAADTAKGASGCTGSESQEAPQSDRGLIEGQADSTVADQATGSSAAIRPAPVARTRKVKVKEDPNRPSYIEMN